MKKHLSRFLLVSTCVLSASLSAFPQKESLDTIRTRGLAILAEVKTAVEEKYYDPGFHGIDLEKNYKAAREDIKKAERNGHVNSIIAQFLLDFNDSHLFFLPPDRAVSVDYGFRMKMVGNDCFISAVKKGSDAEKQGVKLGDQVYSLETFEPTRESLWKLQYFYNALSPQPKIRLALINPDGKTLRELTLDAVIKTEKEQRKEFKEKQKKDEEKDKDKPKDEKKLEGFGYKCAEADADAMVCQLRTFSTPEKEIDNMMEMVGQHKSLILDLRNNGGGYVRTMKRLVGYFFDHQVKVGTEKMRRTSKEEIADSVGSKIFGGKLVVLIDSNSGSASEVFSRVMQLEKRATIVGDRSAGAVMTSVRGLNAYQRLTAADQKETLNIYGLSITIADLIMSDGKSLETVGVQPDIPALPSGDDVRSKRDVAMAKAAQFLGVSLDAERAGKLFLSEEEKTEVSGDDNADEK